MTNPGAVYSDDCEIGNPQPAAVKVVVIDGILAAPSRG
jgi:hypothetical protein